MTDEKQEPAYSAAKLSAHVACYGVILLTERYDACVEFYRNRLGLPFWYEKEGLCCLRFGAGYLMIEREGVGKAARKTPAENPTILRFNVANVPEAARSLEAQGIVVDIEQHSWGVTGSFVDPDGNVCELKNADDPYFA
ncbi:VOC family protein [Radicibacter daui]|uniref:VOC family protein n=1 Tax=Radicibacter daui TaxID=3064829 RepID=UPI004046CA7E